MGASRTSLPQLSLSRTLLNGCARSVLSAETPRDATLLLAENWFFALSHSEASPTDLEDLRDQRAKSQERPEDVDAERLPRRPVKLAANLPRKPSVLLAENL